MGCGGTESAEKLYYENKGPLYSGQHLLKWDVTTTNYLFTFFQNIIQKVPTQGTAMASGK